MVIHDFCFSERLFEPIYRPLAVLGLGDVWTVFTYSGKCVGLHKLNSGLQQVCRKSVTEHKGNAYVLCLSASLNIFRAGSGSSNPGDPNQDEAGLEEGWMHFIIVGNYLQRQALLETLSLLPADSPTLFLIKLLQVFIFVLCSSVWSVRCCSWMEAHRFVLSFWWPPERSAWRETEQRATCWHQAKMNRWWQGGGPEPCRTELCQEPHRCGTH